jgi:hypothetical protein
MRIEKRLSSWKCRASPHVTRRFDGQVDRDQCFTILLSQISGIRKQLGGGRHLLAVRQHRGETQRKSIEPDRDQDRLK